MEKKQLTETLDLGAWLGRKQAFSLLAGKCSAADAECLRNLKAQKAYKALCRSWEEFCRKHVGVSRSAAEKTISLLNEFGPQYFELSAVVRMTPEEYRRIAPAVTRDGVQHGGRLLEISMDNAPALSEAVEDLRQKTEALIVAVPEDDFDKSFDRARRSVRAAVEGLRRLKRPGIGGERQSRLYQEVRRATQEMGGLMKEVAEKIL
jgi:hypothetical protein